MKTIGIIFLLLFIWVAPAFSQGTSDVDDDSSSTESEGVLPPPELRDWTPFKEQFKLYVNFDGSAEDSLPRIDIVDDKYISQPFWLEKLGDTLYVFVVPPQYVMNEGMKIRNTVNGLEDEFPFVVWAGTDRATFWFSHESGKVMLDTLQPAPFLNVASIQPLSNDILWIQLRGTSKNAKTIRLLLDELKEFGDAVQLTQLDDGYYENIWFRVHKTTLQRWKVNETQAGTLLAFRCSDPTSYAAISQILQKYR